MVPSTPTGEPDQLVAGDTWIWRIADLVDYPQSEGWQLKYELNGIDRRTITPTFQTSGDDINHWLVSQALADTDVVAGTYRLIPRVVGSGTYLGEEYNLRDGDRRPIVLTVTVLPDPTIAKPGEFQTEAERNLAVVDAKIAGRLSADLESYSIAGRSVSRIPMRELIAIRARLRIQVRRERTGRVGQTVLTRFVVPT